MIIFLGTHLEPLSYLIYLVAFFLQYRQDRAAKRFVLFVYYSVAAVLAAYANWLLLLPQDDPQNYNDLVYNILFILVIPFLAYYFLHTLVSRAGKNVIRILTALILLFFANELLHGRAALFNSLIAALSYAFPVLCAFIYYYETLTNVKEHDIIRDFDFWVVSAYMFHFLGNFFIVLAWYHLSNIYRGAELEAHKYEFTMLWSVHNVLLFLSAAITLTFSVWISYHRASSSPS